MAQAGERSRVEVGELVIVAHYDPMPEEEQAAVMRRVYAILLDPDPSPELTEAKAASKIGVPLERVET